MIKITRDFSNLANQHKEKLKADYKLDKKITKKLACSSGNIKDFYIYLKGNLDCILTATPSEISNTIIPAVNAILGDDFFNKSNKNANEQEIVSLRKILNYDNFSKYKEPKYCAFSLVALLNINVCPYCNRQYITRIKPEKDKGGTRPTLDHFYLKSEYPYLALSFWNLIPSCYSCNSQLRGTKKIGLHPYEQGFEKILHFYTDINSVDDFIGNAKQDISIILDSYKKQPPNSSDFINANENKNVFRLDDIYQENHKDDVRELIKRAIIYDKAYSQSLSKQFPDLFNNEDDARKTMLANYTHVDDLEKKPLAKLTKDIVEELGI